MNVEIERGKNLQNLNSLATPAVAERYCAPENTAELTAALDYARREQLPVTVLGEGSNVVLGDSLSGLVVHLRTRGRTVLEEASSQVILAVEGGENWHSLMAWCLQRGYHGLENLALIPGTVGAVPIQNVGAYGVEAGQFIERVHYRDLSTGEPGTLLHAACAFGYRDSIFKRELRDKVVVEQVVFRLPRHSTPVLDYPSLANYLREQGIKTASPRQVFEAVVAIRSQRLPDPATVPNAGSFFKNPVLDTQALQSLLIKLPAIPQYPKNCGRVAVPAAYLIEASAGAIQRDGPVRLHPEHALVIINPDRVGARAIREFAAKIAAAVSEQFGILLEQEPRDYG